MIHPKWEFYYPEAGALFNKTTQLCYSVNISHFLLFCHTFWANQIRCLDDQTSVT